MNNKVINSEPDYKPENSIPYSELKVGRKYSFTDHISKEIEGILHPFTKNWDTLFALISSMVDT
jgi:hypothetical protein